MEHFVLILACQDTFIAQPQNMEACLTTNWAPEKSRLSDNMEKNTSIPNFLLNAFVWKIGS